jgi:uncharacterized protein (PEP-CTERM system associated)
LQGNVGNTVRYLVRSDNSYTYTTQTDAPLSDAYYGRHLAEIVRIPTPLGASLRVQTDITSYNERPEADQRLEVAMATASYAFNPQLIVGVRGGYERTNYTADEESGPIYGVEVAWSPNPRTRLAGFWESRFFGPSYRADFSNRQRRFAANFSASRSISTYPQLILQLPATGNVSQLLDAILVARFPDPVERAQQTQDLIARQSLPSSLPEGVNIFSQSINVVTSGSTTFALIGVRNTLALNIFYLKTAKLPDAAIPTTFVDFNDNIQKGASLSFNHRLSPIMTLNAILSWRETRGIDETAGIVTDENRLRVQASRELSPRTQAFVGARYQKQNLRSGLAQESSEVAVFIGIAHQL